MIVWLASYPRSGNTFCRSVLNHYFGKQSCSIYGDPSDIGANAELGALVGHQAGTRDSLDLGEFRSSNEHFFIKTHELPDATISDKDLVFNIIRDGRDACVSYLRYSRKVAGHDELPLQDVLRGAVQFGLWGNHVLRWHQAGHPRMHQFRFEDITARPEAFADELSDVLSLKRSNEPFPEFAKFQKAAPSFFGSGETGTHKAVFSDADVALFEMYNGPAMRLAGYAAGGLADGELKAYDVFCRQLGEITRLEHDVAQGQEDLAVATSERRTLEQALSALTIRADKLEQQHAALAREYGMLVDRHNTVRRYTGLAAFQRVLALFRSRP
ncbi:sulfotransferase domain-containing protein [Methyloceanibacter sp.]|uniref:sulfotransferase domain-containing protein n=1 Tax=Methyloceanibacter sp. TaxID=1965321 RepID=UPI002C27C709|nr:sulfotransferase domain-containing protein [Methyloceanibacter sp.]HML91672.1 sulfotransferase domain-containing protein [Methyloceanibacter sp.]